MSDAAWNLLFRIPFWVGGAAIVWTQVHSVKGLLIVALGVFVFSSKFTFTRS